MYKKILVPLDGSALAEAILPQVKEMARVHDAELVLLRVALAHGFPGVDPTEGQVEAVREAEKYLEEMEKTLKDQRIKVTTVVRYGHPAEEILDHADFAGIDLVAMSTHGRTGVSRWVLGSVAEKILRASGTPLLLVRAPGAGQVAPDQRV
jgi:nucleotide-binding universal stress UspA family protein